MKKFFKFIAIFIIAIFVISLFTDSEDNAEATGSKRIYPVELISKNVINPATVGVRFSVKNDGTQPVKPTCTVRMRDASVTYKGWDVVEFLEDIQPGQSKHAIVQLTIENEGAYYADMFSAECSAYTTDTQSIAGKEIQVYGIENCSWGDDKWELDENKDWPEDAWLGYGPCFKVSESFGTLMNCTWTAFDKDNNVVGTHTARYNTLNGGSTTAYGQNEKWYIEDTEKVVKSVETFEVICKL